MVRVHPVGEPRWGRPRTRLGLLLFTVSLVTFLAVGASRSAIETTAPPVILIGGLLILAFVPRAIPPSSGGRWSWFFERISTRSAARAYYLQLAVGIVGAVVALEVGAPIASSIAAGIVAVLGTILDLTSRSEA
jgi:hypothetical protein